MSIQERIGEGTAEAQAPALRFSLSEVVQRYEAMRDGGLVTRERGDGVVDTIEEYPGLEAEAAAFEKAVQRAKTASCIGGAYGGDVFDTRTEPGTSTVLLQRALLRSAWRHVYNGLPVSKCASAKDRKQIALFLENPPELTMAAIREQFGAFLLDPRHHILKGLAECFCDLDPAYKSHSRVKIGVAGLPKRIIINHVDEYLHSWGGERLKDAINALQTFRGDPPVDYMVLRKMVEEAQRHGEADWPGGTLRLFKNGNAHMIFNQGGLLDINRALAEFYGDVLPDAPSEAEAKRPSKEIARVLQFYPTPRAVAELIVGKIHNRKGGDVLEPSCGDGAILDVLADWHKKEWDHRRGPQPFNCTGIEYDSERAQRARSKGHNVLTANFLEVDPDPRFDAVVMNPPFYGQTYKKHLDHARKFVRPGGVLVSVLPASAKYDHDNYIGHWHDLPVASFASSGTNVPTGYCVWHRPG